MKILALETATDACSAALLLKGQIIQRYELAPRQHGVLILSMVEQLLAEAELSLATLDAVAFGRGPGSFTGLRIAAAVTQGIAFGADLPVAPVSTLAALANGAMREEETGGVIAALDARMDQVYWGAFVRNKNGCAELQGIERVCAPEKTGLLEGKSWYGVGSGWEQYEERLQQGLGNAVQKIFSARYPQAWDVAELAVPMVVNKQTISAEAAVPVYLRDTVANKSGRPS